MFANSDSRVLWTAATVLVGAAAGGFLAHRAGISHPAELLCPITYTRGLRRIFGASESLPPVLAPEQRPYTIAELATHDGEHGDPTDLLVSVKSVVFRVAPQFYGVGMTYHCYAGTEASRNLGKGIVSAEGEKNADWRGLSPAHLADLEAWFQRFSGKYTVVGWIVEDDEFRKRAEAFEP
jgi:hypothetical protein